MATAHRGPKSLFARAALARNHIRRACLLPHDTTASEVLNALQTPHSCGKDALLPPHHRKCRSTGHAPSSSSLSHTYRCVPRMRCSAGSRPPAPAQASAQADRAKRQFARPSLSLAATSNPTCPPDPAYDRHAVNASPVLQAQFVFLSTIKLRGHGLGRLTARPVSKHRQLSQCQNAIARPDALTRRPRRRSADGAFGNSIVLRPHRQEVGSSNCKRWSVMFFCHSAHHVIEVNFIFAAMYRL